MKETINNLKDYAELAQASYFYFDLFKDSQGIPRKIYELDSKNDKIKDESYPRGYKEIKVNLENSLSKKYYKKEVLINLKQDNTWQSDLLNSLDKKTNFDKLNGEFGEIQTKNFLNKYDLLHHQPNTDSGFSATLFKDTKADSKDSEYILSFRGTELN